MKKHALLPISLFLILSFIVTIVSADDVDIAIAKNVAINLYTERAINPNTGVGITNFIEEQHKGKVLFYVMQYSNKGFALISAQDNVQPILGYSFTSEYNKNAPPAFKDFIINRFRNEIVIALQEKYTPDSKTVNSWVKYSQPPAIFQPENTEVTEPMLTSIWDQDWPYNAHCPPDASGPGGHALVGCVATAMAQVLNFWQHPWHGEGSHAYTPEDHPEYGQQSVDFGSTYYNFDNMLDTAIAYSSDLADLSYHCAVAVDMNFGPESSGAWGDGSEDVSNALKNYFYFSSGALDVSLSDYTSSEWFDLMKNNVENGYPVIYGSHDSGNDSGHAWVLDGIDSGDLFHCNWGWGGSHDGYFAITNLNPGTHNYDSQQHACVNISPKVGTVSGTYTLAGSPYTFHYDHVIEADQVLNIEAGVEIKFDGRYKLIVRGQINAQGNYGGYVRFEPEMPEIGMQGVVFEDLNLNSMDSSKLINCIFENGKGHWDPYSNLSIGGGIYCKNSSKLLIKNTRISYCSADYGGGIAITDTSNIRMHHNFIKDDTSVFYGGGIFIDRSNVVLSDNDISDNQTTGTYGAYSTGGGVYCRLSDVSFFKDVIENNYAFTVGGIGFDRSTATMDSVTITTNETPGYGGGVYVGDTSDVTINNSEISENYANWEGGGAIYVQNMCNLHLNKTLVHNNYAIYGSAISVSANSIATINSSTIAENRKNPFTPVAGITVGSLSDLHLNSSILWDNGTTEITKDEDCLVNASYSIIENGTWTGTGVSNADPLFVSSATYDYRLNWFNYPMPDGGKSGAIDAGDPALPADPDGTPADMGVFTFEQNYTPINTGNLSGTLTCANSPYYLFGNATIASGDELTIEPCVKVIARGDYYIKVQGRLLAEGTATDQIVFASADTTEGWQGFRFIHTNSNGQDSSKLVHCRVTYGIADGGSEYDRGGALYFYNSSKVLVQNCLINKNRAESIGGAIYATGSGVNFKNNVFEHNQANSGGVFYGNSAGSVYFTDNVFQNNQANNGGAFTAYSSSIYLYGNSIKNNRAEVFGGAIYYASGGNFVFDPTNKNSVYNNYAGGAGLELYYDGYHSSVDVILDTFTVQNPNKHFAHPLEKFNISLDNYVVQQISLDLYVSPFGSDENTGATWGEALKTMHMACMKIMADAGNPRTIYLDAGVFSESYTNEVFPINWRDHVSMQGEGRDVTILDGENKNQVLYCYNDSDLEINDLTIRNGYGEYGGGIRIENESSPLINRVEVINSFAEEQGGGIYCYDYCDPVLSHVQLSNNSTENHGGGISFYNYCDAQMIHCTVEDNFAIYKGGGIEVEFYSDVIIDSCIVLDNTAAHGGGILITWDSDGAVTNSTINSNDALSHVGGYFGMGGAIWISYLSDPILENNEIWYNHADWQGGAIYASSQSYAIGTNCSLMHNSAKMGAGLYLNGNANHTYYNLVLYNNAGGEGYGGAIYNSGSNPKFYNATITNNTIDTTSAFSYSGGALYNYNGNPEFHNSILWDNVPNEITEGSGTVQVSYSNIKGGYTGTGNIDLDPDLIYVYYLQEGSPCIDAGNPDTTGMNLPTTDIIDSARIANNRVDMGANEYKGPVHFIEFQMALFLEGPFNGVDMDTWLTSNPEMEAQFPLSQPFDTAPWNYSGEESTTFLPDNVVDWVLIEIRDAPLPADATPATVKARQAALLLQNGTVVAPDGSTSIVFENLSIDDMMWPVIYHRNHLSFMSNAGCTPGAITLYNFYVSDFAAYNSYLGGYKELAPGIWGMVAGDANGDGDIDLTDRTLWQSASGRSTYTAEDLNLDGQVNNKDKNEFWLINQGEASQVPE